MNGPYELLTDLSVLGMTGYFDRLRGMPLSITPVTDRKPGGRTRMAMMISTIENAAVIEVGVGHWTPAMATALLGRAAAVFRERGFDVDPIDFPSEVPSGVEDMFAAIEFEESPPLIRWGKPDGKLVVTFLR